MSEVTKITDTANQLTNNYDVSKFLLGFNSFIEADMTAGATDEIVTQGLVLGRIAATGKVVALDPAATDGSQYPVGLAIVDITVVAGATKTLNIVNKGKIAESFINFSGATTLDSVVGDRTLRDWLNDLGLELAGGEELTNFDN